MRTVLAGIVGVAACVLLAACTGGDGAAAHNDMAAAGALPGLRSTVGPIPGPKSHLQPIVNPYANDPVARQDGRRLFIQMNCYGCHGGHAGGGMGPSLRNNRWIYGDSDSEIFDSIASGRANGMPAWGTKLSDQQIWELVAYIKALSTPDEPQPPTPPVIPKQGE